jgi:Ser/Thr protein kinase RdoA (MazF antagonist)
MSAPERSEIVMTSLVSQIQCPLCGRPLEVLVVNPAGELIGCEDCAEERGLAGEVLTYEEWSASAAVAEALAQFDLAGAIGRKPVAQGGQQPRAHYWEVVHETQRYYLKRFYSWYPVGAIRHMHSVLSHLASGDRPLPVPTWMPSAAGASWVEAAGARWALYRSLDGRPTTNQDWMWGRPKAAEMLALLHLKLESFTPDGEEFQPWGAWTLDTVDRVLESWQPHPDLPPELLGHVRDRLAARYFDYLYPELPKLVVHGDYIPANLLWRTDAISSSVSGVLDFEKAHRDTALFDFAWGLGDRRPPLLRATIATYSRIRPLSPVEREALPEALLLGAFMDIDMQMTYFNNLEEVSRLAQELHFLVRDIESLRRAAAPK